jgi:hypothetical protein
MLGGCMKLIRKNQCYLEYLYESGFGVDKPNDGEAGHTVASWKILLRCGPRQAI